MFRNKAARGMGGDGVRDRRHVFRHCLFISLGLAVSFGSFGAVLPGDYNTDPTPSASLSDLENFSNGADSVDAAKIGAIRENGIRVGIQGGMLARGKILAEQASGFGGSLDRIFQFQPMLDRDGFLPPVVSEIRQKVETLHSAQRIEYAGVVYKIVQPARFVRVVPTWRDYLFTGLVDSRMKVDPLPEAIRPKTDAEKAVWKSSVDKGWAQGIKQADEVFVENIQRLKSDYIGMIRYVYLRNEGMIRTPVLSKTPDGVSVTNDEISIGTGTKAVEVPARMEPDTAKWGKNH